MKKLLFIAAALVPLLAWAVTENKTWRIPPGGNLPSWGALNLSDAVNAVTGFLRGSNGGSPLSNVNVSVSVNTPGANAMTIALKGVDGTDPSTLKPVCVDFRSTTANSGNLNTVCATAPVSMVVSAGSTLGIQLSGEPMPTYVYAINNLGSLELAVSTSFQASDFTINTTAEGGAGAADTSTGYYSTTAHTNVPAKLIARLESTQAVAGNWASAFSIVVSQPGLNDIWATKARAYTVSTSDLNPGIGGVIRRNFPTFSTTSASPVAVPDSTITLISSGRPIMVGFVSTSTGCNLLAQRASNGSAQAFLQIFSTRPSGPPQGILATTSEVFGTATGGVLRTRVPVGGLMQLDVGSSGVPGTYTYTPRINSSIAGTVTATLDACAITAYEL